MKYQVGVLFGSESVEHEISIISANQAINALDTNKYEVIPLYIGKNRQLYFGELLSDIKNFKDLDNLIKQSTQVTLVKQDNKCLVIPVKNKLFSKPLASIDIIVPVVHGTNCEDGTVQGLIEMLKVPYVGCNVLAAAVGQDKVFMKHILENNGVPVLPWTWFYSNEFENNQKELINKLESKLEYPMIVKPANLGSSVGISPAKNKKELIEAIIEAKQFDQKIVVEKMLESIVEVNCSVLGNHNSCIASCVEEIVNEKEFLSYSEKYLSGSKSKGMANTSRIIPARLTDKETELVKQLAIDTFLNLDSSGVARVDLIKDLKSKKFFVNEINTIPGSLSFYLWQEVGVDFTQLMDRLIEIALDNYRIKEMMTFSYSTNVLSNFGGSKGSKGVKG